MDELKPVQIIEQLFYEARGSADYISLVSSNRKAVVVWEIRAFPEEDYIKVWFHSDMEQDPSFVIVNPPLYVYVNPRKNAYDPLKALANTLTGGR